MKIPKALPADAGGSAESRKRSRPKNKVQPREFYGGCEQEGLYR